MEQAIVCNNFEVLLVTLDSLIEPGAGATEQELAAIKAELASFIDQERGWNVFHFAAHHQSDSIMEKLVEFLGILFVTQKMVRLATHCFLHV